jgi:hypothetical protein
MNKTYTNKSGSKVLEYLSNDTIVLELPFIMTIVTFNQMDAIHETGAEVVAMISLFSGF